MRGRKSPGQLTLSCATLVLAVLASLPGHSAPPGKAGRQTYAVTDLADLSSGPTGGVADVNDAGQVCATLPTGGSDALGNPIHHAFIIEPGTGRVDLGTLGGSNSFAMGINDAGAVVGASETGATALSGSPQLHAFLWTPAEGMRDISHPDAASATAHSVNASTQVVGDQDGEAFYWDPAEGLQQLGKLPGDETSTATSINDSGLVIGTSLDVPPAPPSLPRLFAWDAGGGLRVVGGLTTLNTSARVNRSGVMTGSSFRLLEARFDKRRILSLAGGFSRTEAGELRSLGPSFRPIDISDAGEVIGTNFGAPSVHRGGRTAPLGLRIPPYDGWRLESVAAINGGGQIVGVGTLDGIRRALLLTPDPEPNCAEEFTSRVILRRATLPRHVGRGRIELRVSVHNPGPATVLLPDLALDRLDPAIRWLDIDGYTQCVEPTGMPYRRLGFGNDRDLLPGERITVTLSFRASSIPAGAFRMRVFGGRGVR